MAKKNRQGIYNVEYFSGSQASLYIGDVWVDEVTSLSFARHQNRTPLYGYADQLFRQVSKGQVLVQGSFSINFKEAGYLWLVLNRYKKIMRHRRHMLEEGKNLRRPLSPFSVGKSAEEIDPHTIEQIVNGDVVGFDRNKILQEIAAGEDVSAAALSRTRRGTRANLTGFSSSDRANGTFAGKAESAFEAFENKVWKTESNEVLNSMTRQADHHDLNPFDIFVVFGDYTGNDNENHTVQKLTDVYILGNSKQIVIDGQPIQEVYSFIGRNII